MWKVRGEGSKVGLGKGREEEPAAFFQVTSFPPGEEANENQTLTLVRKDFSSKGFIGQP